MAIYDDGHRILTEPAMVWSGNSCRVCSSMISGGICSGDIFRVHHSNKESILIVPDTTKYSRGSMSPSGKWGRYQSHYTISGGICEIIINWLQHACYDCYRRNTMQCIYRLNRR